MKTGATAREFLNRHLGHSATVEWNRSGFKFFSQQPLAYEHGSLLSAAIKPLNPAAMCNDTDFRSCGPPIPIDRIRAVYCCGEHWSAE